MTNALLKEQPRITSTIRIYYKECKCCREEFGLVKETDDYVSIEKDGLCKECKELLKTEFQLVIDTFKRGHEEHEIEWLENYYDGKWIFN